jgi:hypothetical protein
MKHIASRKEDSGYQDAKNGFDHFSLFSSLTAFRRKSFSFENYKMT